MDWYIAVLKKYAEFSGRARRKEYWMFALISFLISLVIGVLGNMVSGLTVLTWVYTLATLVPSIAVGVRRLHDTGRSGWWGLIAFIPLLGAIIVLVFLCQDSAPGDNAYGPNPKTAAPIEAMPIV